MLSVRKQLPSAEPLEAVSTARVLTLALLVLGSLLLAGPAYLTYNAYECGANHSIHVEADSSVSSEPTPFDSLTERQQAVFLEARDDGSARVSKEVSLPGAVQYENQTYAVYEVHGDGCGVLLLHPIFWLLTLGGAGSLALGVRRYRRE